MSWFSFFYCVYMDPVNINMANIYWCVGLITHSVVYNSLFQPLSITVSNVFLKSTSMLIFKNQIIFWIKRFLKGQRKCADNIHINTILFREALGTVLHFKRWPFYLSSDTFNSDEIWTRSFSEKIAMAVSSLKRFMV